MHWTTLLIVMAFVTILFLLKRSGQISRKDAKAHLQNGAIVIDVRSPAEFSSGHLPSAVNLPMDQIERALPQRVKDRNKPLLLHCHSGMRSGVARKKLQTLGYTNVYNLGSYSRAARVVND